MSRQNTKHHRIVRLFINQYGKIQLRQLQFHIRNGVSDEQLEQAYQLDAQQIAVFREICRVSTEDRLLG
ncbi:MAG: hypothetical protein VX278_06035 [Myxococcota bacterium]|nr:hypothetical protein [Myxococcota bacterium]